MTAYLEMRAVGRHGQYDVLHNGEVLCRSSEPLLAGCRKLIERGHSPWDIVEIRHEGEPGYSMRTRVWKAAGLTIREEARRGPELTAWKANPRAAVAALARFSCVGAPDLPAEGKIDPCATAGTAKSEVSRWTDATPKR